MKKKEIAYLFTDLHLNLLNKDICLDFIKFFTSKIKKKIPIFFLGDFFDSRNGQSEPVSTTAKQIFQILNKNNKVYYIDGNHDKYIETSFNSYLLTFSPEIINLFSKVSFIENKEYEYFFFPYFEEEVFDEQLNNLITLSLDAKGKKKILFAHYMYEQLPLELTKNFDKIFLGHNHEREEFPKGEYIGSCFQQNFSEDNNKGFSILYDDLSTELVKYEGREYINQVIDMNYFTEEKAKQFILEFKEKYKNKFLRIEFIGFNKDISDLKEFCKINHINCISKINNEVIKDSENKNILISELSENQIKFHLEEFCKIQNIPQKIQKLLMFYIDKEKQI